MKHSCQQAGTKKDENDINKLSLYFQIKKKPYLIIILTLIIFIFIQGLGVRSSELKIQDKVADSRFRITSSGFKGQDSKLRVKDSSGFSVQGSVFKVADSMFRITSSGFKGQDSKSRVQSSLEIFAQTAMAQDNQTDEGLVGNAKKGKHFFKDVCRQCHSPGSPHKELTPMTKTMDQWQTYFKLRYFIHHKGVKLGDQSLLEITTQEMISHIKTFLLKHAADSDQPQTCG